MLIIGVVAFLLLVVLLKVLVLGGASTPAKTPAAAPSTPKTPVVKAVTPASRPSASIADVRKAFGKAGLALTPAHGIAACSHAKGCKTVLAHAAPKHAGRTLVYVFSSPAKAKAAQIKGAKREGRIVVGFEGAKVRAKNAKRVSSVLDSLSG